MNASAQPLIRLNGIKKVDKLRFLPCLPADWEEFKLNYRFRETMYRIAVFQTQAPRPRSAGKKRCERFPNPSFCANT